MTDWSFDFLIRQMLKLISNFANGVIDEQKKEQEKGQTDGWNERSPEKQECFSIDEISHYSFKCNYP